MISSALRREVLNSFKKLHRTRQSVFRNSDKHSESARAEINKKYRENLNVTDADSVKDLVKFAGECEYVLKTTVVELEQTGPGRFKMHLRPELFEEQENSCTKKYIALRRALQETKVHKKFEFLASQGMWSVLIYNKFLKEIEDSSFYLE